MTDGLDPLEPSPYKTLSVPKDAPLSAIRSAHRKLVLLYHPDKVQNEADKKAKGELFHQVQQAYEILSDDNRRRRWDDRARLAELRADIMNERPPPPPRRAQTYGSPMYEMRDGRIYEERVPKAARTYTEDFASPSAGSRPSSRKYEDRYDETPSRKTSGRGPEDRRRYPLDEEYLEKKQREKRAKDEEDRRRAEKDKKRDKERKRDAEATFRSRKPYIEEVEDTSESEPEGHYFSRRPDSKSKQRDEDSRKYREDPIRKNGKKGSKARSDEELERKERAAWDYMRRSSEQVDDIRHSGRKRADSHKDQTPLSPPLTPVDGGRRSSGDDARKASKSGRGSRQPSPIRKSTKGKKNIEIVDAEPSPRAKPKLQNGYSDRSYLQEMANTSKSRREPQRSATDRPTKKFEHPGLARSETMPIHNMRRGPPQSQPSKLNTNHHPSDSSDSSDLSDSDSETEIPPPPPPRPQPQPRQQSTRYHVARGDDERPARAVYASPDEFGPRSRDVSPKNARRSTSDRHARPPPISRAATFQERPSPRPSNNYSSYRGESPRLKTHQSARGGEDLFGAVPEDYSPRTHGSPKLFPVSGGDRHERGSGRRDSKDVDPYAHRKSHRRQQRSEGLAT